MGTRSYPQVLHGDQVVLVHVCMHVHRNGNCVYCTKGCGSNVQRGVAVNIQLIPGSALGLINILIIPVSSLPFVVA